MDLGGNEKGGNGYLRELIWVWWAKKFPGNALWKGVLVWSVGLMRQGVSELSVFIRFLNG